MSPNSPYANGSIREESEYKGRRRRNKKKKNEQKKKKGENYEEREGGTALETQKKANSTREQREIGRTCRLSIEQIREERGGASTAASRHDAI